MAYTPGTLSQIAAATLESDFGVYVYMTADSVATCEGTNYFSDAQQRGIRQLGDIVYLLVGATPASYVLTMCAVTALQSGGYGATITALTAQASTSLGTGAVIANTAISTTGATGTLTAAAIAGGVITRTGPTAPFTDTTDSAANIIAAMTVKVIGNVWRAILINNTVWPETLSAGASVTLSGLTIVPPNSWLEYLVTYTGAGAVSIYGVGTGLNTSPAQTLYVQSAITLVSQTGVQPAFVGASGGVLANGEVTLPTGTYEFEAEFNLSAMSSTSGGFGFALGTANSAVIGEQAWSAFANKATLATPAAPQFSWNTAANTELAAATTNTVGYARIKGSFTLTTAGSIIPELSFTTVTGSASPVVGVGSMFKVWPIGSATVSSVGNWS